MLYVTIHYRSFLMPFEECSITQYIKDLIRCAEIFNINIKCTIFIFIKRDF